MKVLVTGGMGFIGQHVCEALESRDIEPVIFDRYERQALQADSKYERFLGDIRSREAVDYAVSVCHGAINLAGVLGTSETVDDPFPSVETNIRGALNFLQACRKYDRPGVQIAVGNHFMNNSYSITKTTAERFALMFNQEHDTKIAVVRALNAYGERQKARPVRKIMPNFILPALENKPIEIFGDGEQVMDMIYVKDVAEILVRALLHDHGKHDTVFEAGTGRKTTVNKIAEIVIKETGSTGGIKHLPMRAGEPKKSVVLGDPKTLRPLFDHPPALVKLETGVRDTVKWYRENHDLFSDNVNL